MLHLQVFVLEPYGFEAGKGKVFLLKTHCKSYEVAPSCYLCLRVPKEIINLE